MSGKEFKKEIDIRKILEARRDLVTKQLAIPSHPQDKKPHIAEGQLASHASIMHSLDAQLKALEKSSAQKKRVDKRKREETEQPNSDREKKPHAENTASQVGNGEFKAPAPRPPRGKTSKLPPPPLSIAPLENNPSNNGSSFPPLPTPSLTNRLLSGNPSYRQIRHPPIMENGQDACWEEGKPIRQKDKEREKGSEINPLGKMCSILLDAAISGADKAMIFAPLEFLTPDDLLRLYHLFAAASAKLKTASISVTDLKNYVVLKLQDRGNSAEEADAMLSSSHPSSNSSSSSTTKIDWDRNISSLWHNNPRASSTDAPTHTSGSSSSSSSNNHSGPNNNGPG